MAFRLGHVAQQQVAAGGEAGPLQGMPRGDVAEVAARGRDGSEFAAEALQFLHEVRAVPASAEGFVDLHVHVAVRGVVVEEQSAFTQHFAVLFQRPFATASP